MKKTTLLLLFIAILPLKALAQHVFIQVAGNAYPIKQEQTQTEVKPGWTIVDIKTRDKKIQYLWGSRATQMAESHTPTLIIYPGEKETLADYVLIRLRRRKQYRRLMHSPLAENEYIRFTPDHFTILPSAGLGFACTPKDELVTGEYIIAYLNQTPVGEFGDYMVYSFSVRKE